jgi:hypothetical protein
VVAHRARRQVNETVEHPAPRWHCLHQPFESVKELLRQSCEGFNVVDKPSASHVHVLLPRMRWSPDQLDARRTLMRWSRRFS